MKIGNRIFDTEHDCYIMAILNVTPDSFSDGGKWNDVERAKQHVAQMIAEGAAIIDVGGESTRPGHQQITVQEEIDRVVPVIEMLKQNFDIPVSIDSYKSQVVEAALKAGADMVNDIWGFKYDKKTAELTARYQVPCCLMHNRDKAEYTDFMQEMCEDLRECAAIAKEAGVADDKIILDPVYPCHILPVIFHFSCPLLSAAAAILSGKFLYMVSTGNTQARRNPCQHSSIL